MRGLFENYRGLVTILVLVLLAVVSLPFSSAKTRNTAITVTISNNSSRELHHIYTQADDAAPLSGDLLNGAVINPGSSNALSGITCDTQSTKIITEDKDGCFLSKTVACSGDTTWTITNDDTPNCGN